MFAFHFSFPGEKVRVASVGRLVTPRSSVGYAYESVEHSDEEGMDHTIEEDNICCTYDENLVASADHVILMPELDIFLDNYMLNITCISVWLKFLSEKSEKWYYREFFSDKFRVRFWE